MGGKSFQGRLKKEFTRGEYTRITLLFLRMALNGFSLNLTIVSMSQECSLKPCSYAACAQKTLFKKMIGNH